MARIARAVLAALCIVGALGACSPTTLVERAVEARSAEDIAEDNRIVLKVNRIMADLGDISASTEIYEQRLLVTGLFDDKETYETFRRRVRAVDGVEQLYWHAVHMSESEQAKREGELLDWGEVVVLDNRVGVDLISTRGIADVNFRVAADPFATVYLLGRARSEEERSKALRVARNAKGVRKVVSYVEVRP
jgi:hyperosmotically inducible protein